jgi:hypothetical protein
MDTGGKMRRFSALLILAGMLCLVIAPAAAFDDFSIPYIRFGVDRDSCSIAHLTDCQITFIVYYGYLGVTGPEWSVFMSWNPLQMKLVKPMQCCIHHVTGDGIDDCYGGDYEGGQTMTLQVIDPTLPEGTLLTNHILVRGPDEYYQEKSVVVPEFPTAVLPAAIISGFLGVVLFFRRPRNR